MTAVIVKNTVGIYLKSLSEEILKRNPNILIEAAWIATGEVRREVVSKQKSGTGALARSFVPGSVKVEKDQASIGTFSDLPYAGIQNRGGTIQARGEYLAIPIGDRARNVAGLWPRDWAKNALFAFRSRQGNLLLARRDRKPGDSDFLQYLLRRAVTLSSHSLKGYLDRAKVSAEPEIRDLFDEATKKAIKETKVKGEKKGIT